MMSYDEFKEVLVHEIMKEEKQQIEDLQWDEPTLSHDELMTMEAGALINHLMELGFDAPSIVMTLVKISVPELTNDQCNEIMMNTPNHFDS